jgi:hypothetical protein
MAILLQSLCIGNYGFILYIIAGGSATGDWESVGREKEEK